MRIVPSSRAAARDSRVEAEVEVKCLGEVEEVSAQRDGCDPACQPQQTGQVAALREVSYELSV